MDINKCIKACSEDARFIITVLIEKKGVLEKIFKRKFRENEDWELDVEQFKTLKRKKQWEFTTEMKEEKK